MSALPKRYFNPDEYLTPEVKADYKSQYASPENCLPRELGRYFSAAD